MTPDRFVSSHGPAALVAGTRPEIIKLAPVVRALERLGTPMCFIFTGQQRDLGTAALAAWGVRVDENLDVMKQGQQAIEVLGRIALALPPVLARHQAAYLVVQGDTTTACAGALVGFECGLPVAHVEAGLRTHRPKPFPEEGHRRLIAPVTSLHLAPTERARANLMAEGIEAQSIAVTGNTAVDAVLYAAKQPRTAEASRVLESLNGRRLVLCTAHRRESFGAPMREIFGAIRDLAQRHRGRCAFILPLHPNPEVTAPAREILGGSGVLTTDPFDPITMAHLLAGAHLVLTDSGGLVEEAPSFRVPCLILRNEVDRPEAIDAGCAKMVGTQRSRIVEEADKLLGDPLEHARMRVETNPFGDGAAAGRIAELLTARWWRQR